MFDHIVGNEPIKSYFSKAVHSNTLPTALLITGIQGVGKTLFAHALASYLLQTDKPVSDPVNSCTFDAGQKTMNLRDQTLETHPDFHPLKPESKSGLHSIESLRNLIDEVYSSSYLNFGKVFIIYDAHRMQTAAANAILKTLEEPNPDTTLILISSDANAILPTIRSRCALIALKPIREDLIAAHLSTMGHDPKWAKISLGSIGHAIKLATQPSFEQAIFDLLNNRPIYPKLLAALEKIEALVETEDPLEKNRNVERLFSAFLIWHRDQYALQFGGKPYFPENKLASFPLLSLEKIIVLVDQARMNFQRNIKLFSCLEQLFT